MVHELDFRPGGRERLETRFDDGTEITFEAAYHDIVTDERIIYAYEMHLGGQP